MLDLKFIISKPEYIKEKTALRGASVDIDLIMGLDKERRELISKSEELKRTRNEISRRVGEIKRTGGDATELMKEVNNNASLMDEYDKYLKETEETLNACLLEIPNLVDDSTPVGKNEADNPIYLTWGEPKTFSFTPKDHTELGTALNILDFERGAKVARARFTFLKNKGARLERALINFMMDLHTKRGYEEVIPPYLVNPTTMTGTGQLPKFQEDAFWCERDDLYLIPTAEVPVTNLYSNEILPESTLPLRYTAYSTCFRREAGSYGKDVKGYIRQHQFNKVELVKFSTPEKSMEELEEMLEAAREVLIKLELPHRVVTLCTGDIGFSAKKTYDIEVWLPGQNCFREISSCSNCGDFQARRANIRMKGAEGKPTFLHTLNGSGLAVGRTLIAVLENYQQADGSVLVPEVLRPYMGCDVIK